MLGKHQDLLAPLHTSRLFLVLLPGRKISSARGVSHSQYFYFVIVFAFLIYFVCCILYQKSKKNSLLFIVVIFIACFIFVQWLVLVLCPQKSKFVLLSNKGVQV